MNERTRDQVESWDTRPVSGGHRGLAELVDGGFSGVVEAQGTWLFMLNGRGVGVYGGPVDVFEDGEATAYLAPDPSLPLLFAMQEEGGQVEAKYYTNDTPLSEANRTLTNGGFTGFIELSENVLSGDYYVVYYGGRSMSCAFVGESERLLTGDEAFQRANDEVGIYQVEKVDIDVIDLPTPEEPEDESPAQSADPGEDDRPAAGESQPPGGAEPQPEQRAAGSGGQQPPPDQSPAGNQQAGGQSAAADHQPAPGGEPADAPAAEAAGDATEPAPDADAGAAEPAGSQDAGTAEAATPRAGGGGEGDGTVADLDEAAAVGDGDEDAVYSDEAEWQQARTIPSLNPERSGAGSATESAVDVAAGAADVEPGEADGAGVGVAADGVDGAGDDRASSPAAAEAGTGAGPAPGGADAGEAGDKVAELQSALQQRETEMAKFRQQLTTLQDERDELQRERDQLREEVSRLEDEVEQLRVELQQARAAAGDDTDAGHSLSREEALAGTNFFVRYGTKGGGTLEKAHRGEVDREEVNTNLRLEHHTRFDEADVVVDGQPFATFLEGTMESAFVAWVIEDLLYEIRDTSYEGRLRDVFDAVPRIDRAELGGAISVQYEEDGEQYRDDVTFDVVLRDRMGNPLMVANLNDGRDPTTVEMMETLVEDATRVKESHDTLAGALFVTASFFQPGALETADAAASSGLLSRDKRASFVTRASTGGYHLCLVENRGGDFHVNVPDM